VRNKFYSVVVVYNKSVSDSVTLNKLSKITSHAINVFVVDNSTLDFGNKAQCAENGWGYVSMGGNAGLSRAYNVAIHYLKKEKGIVVWLDDDTEITQEYFDELEKQADIEKTTDIFVPLIQGQDGRFWSPNEYHYLRNKQLKDRNQKISPKRFNAINSCTAVRLELYKNYQYTEKLFLDQVDHQFFEDQRNLGRKFKVLNVVIHHNFSMKNRENDVDKVKFRYRIMIPDFLTFCNKTPARYLLGWVKIAGWGVRESLKYKDISFLFWCLKVAFTTKRVKI